jgi:hypothetical protein
MRDFARFIFLWILIVDLSHLDYKVMAKSFGYLFFLILVFDFLFIYQNFSEVVRSGWLGWAANSAFQEFVTDYYRHIGIMGNPNASAAFYGIAVFVFIFFEQIPARLRILGVAIAFLLLFESQSRSYLIATLLSVVIGLTSIGISRVAFITLGVALALYLSLDIHNSVEVFLDRTEELSAFDERTELITALFVNLDMVRLLLGDPLLPAVVDNDIVFFFLRFGLPVMIFLAAIIWRIMPSNIRLAKTRLLYAFVFFGVIGSLAGGIFGHPGLAFLYVCIFRALGMAPVKEIRSQQDHRLEANFADR